MKKNSIFKVFSFSMALLLFNLNTMQISAVGGDNEVENYTPLINRGRSNSAPSISTLKNIQFRANNGIYRFKLKTFNDEEFCIYPDDLYEIIFKTTEPTITNKTTYIREGLFPTTKEEVKEYDTVLFLKNGKSIYFVGSNNKSIDNVKKFDEIFQASCNMLGIEKKSNFFINLNKPVDELILTQIINLFHLHSSNKDILKNFFNEINYYNTEKNMSAEDCFFKCYNKFSENGRNFEYFQIENYYSDFIKLMADYLNSFH